MLDLIARISAALSKAALWFAGLGLVIMTLIIGWQVFGRYVLNASPAWSEQAALVLMIYYVLFAAAAGVREGFHIRLSMVADRIEGWPGQAMRIAAHGVVCLFGIAMAFWGAELVARTWAHDIPTLGLPRGFAYLPLPISGGLIAFFAAEHMLAAFTGRKVEPIWN
ncbi:MAG: TRAP transporter small permease [Henriciella sp.]|nr:TRAP transporter small permease [Henriciella sp.]